MEAERHLRTSWFSRAARPRSSSTGTERYYQASTAALALILMVFLISWLVSGRRSQPARAAMKQATIATQTESDLEAFPALDFGGEPPMKPTYSSSFLHRMLWSCLGTPLAHRAHTLGMDAPLHGGSKGGQAGGWMIKRNRNALEPQNWLEKMIIALTKVKRTRDGIDVPSYLEAMESIPEVYDVLLSLQVVTSFMRRDLHGHVATVRKAAAQVPGNGGATLQGIVRHALANYDHQSLARSTTSMVGGVLWLNRATTFISAFIRGLADGLPSREAAGAAYDSTLRMYHSLMTAAFVSRAMTLCPERDKIIERLRLPSEEVGREQLAAFLGLMEPLVEEIRSFLDASGANFPDRIG